MIKLADKDKCTGCFACYNACRFNALTIELDSLGFFNPIINSKKCVECASCSRVCEAANNTFLQKPVSFYGCVNLNKEELDVSSSGGVFYALSKAVIDLKGVIFGVSLFALRAKHESVISLEDIRRLAGSKYIQSDIGNSYNQVRDYLMEGRIVLFVGTPCQVAGLRAFLNNDYPNLFCVDLFCHGVSNYSIFNGYINYLEKKKRISVIDYKFRGKYDGWGKSSEVVYKKNGTRNVACSKMIIPECKNLFNYAFIEGSIVRRSCQTCKYRCTNRVGDLSIGDFWGAKNVLKKCDTSKGVSKVLVNNNKGVALISMIEKYMNLFPLDVNTFSIEENKIRQDDKTAFLFLSNKVELYDKKIKKTKNYKISVLKYRIKRIIPKRLLLWVKKRTKE